MRFQGARRVHRGTGEGAQVPPGGLAVQFNLRAGQTARRLSITEMTLDPHRLVPPHVRADEDDTHTWRAQIGACRYRPIRARVSSMLATPFASPKNSQASETRSRAESMRKAPPTSRLYGRRRTARPEPGHGTRGAAGCQKLTSVTRADPPGPVPTVVGHPHIRPPPRIPPSPRDLQIATAEREDHGCPPTRTAEERNVGPSAPSGSRDRRTDVSCSIFELLICAVHSPSHD